MADRLLACIPRIDAYLRAWVGSRRLPLNIRRAVEYSLLAGGKRLRPVLAWHCARAVGGRGAESLPAGSAVELVHAFSLCHDDLPAMDDDDLRRGRPTLHRHAGEAMAILAGDLMLALAFDVLTARVRDGAMASRLGEELARASRAMIVGQVYDTIGGLGARVPALDRLRRIHTNKTGALIEASCIMGARLGLPRGIPGEEGRRRLRAVRAYARDIGLMFQVVDDLIDVEQAAPHAGKRTGKDAGAGKLTYPGVVGIAASRAAVERLRRSAVRKAGTFGGRGAALAELAERLAVRSR